MIADLLVVRNAGCARLLVMEADVLDALRQWRDAQTGAAGEAWLALELAILPEGQRTARFIYADGFDAAAGFLRRRRRWLQGLLGHLDVDADTPL